MPTGTTNFLQFNPPSNNQETDSQYAADAQRLGGLGTGDIVPSPLLNKTLYQESTFIAAFAGALALKGISTSDANLAQLEAALASILTTADIKPPLIQVSWGPTVTFDASLANGFDLTLLGNVTSSALINVTAGQEITFIIAQNGAGNNTFAWPSNVRSPGAPDTTANAVTIQKFTVRIDGTIRPSSVPVVS